MNLFLHFHPGDILKLESDTSFIRFEVGAETERFEVHCMNGSRAAFVEQLRQQVDLLVRQEARIEKAAQDALAMVAHEGQRLEREAGKQD